MGSPEPRRKRKRTRRIHSKFSRKDFPLPFLSTILCIFMIVAVSLRKALRTRLNVGQPSDWAGTMSLAIMLQNQHEISLQAAHYADLQGCLSVEPSESFGPFTCVADTSLLVRTLAKELEFETLLVVDVGTSTSTDFTMSREFEGEFGLQIMAYRNEEQSHLPTNTADVILVEVNDDKTAEDLSHLLVDCFQATRENGIVVIFSRRGLGWGHDCQGKDCETGKLGPRDRWKGSTNLRRAVLGLVCTNNSRMSSAAVGDFDGGVVVLRRTNSKSPNPRVDCSKADDLHDTSTAAVFKPLRFEELVFWVLGEIGLVKDVQMKFGGAEALRDNARRRSRRSKCFSKPEESQQMNAAGQPSSDDTKHGRLGSKRQHRARSTKTTKDDSRECLEKHLQAYPNDVRAAFALEMMNAGQGGKHARRRATRLRDMALAKSGEPGALLWSRLYSRAAIAAANPLAGLIWRV